MNRNIHSLTDLVTGPVEIGDIALYHETGGWKSVAAPTFNVRAFGAAGDGQHDDSAAINNAVAAAAANGGGTVQFSSRIHKVSTINVASGIQFAGLAWVNAESLGATNGTTILGSAGSPVFAFPSGTTTRKVGVRDLRIRGGSHGIHLPPGATVTTYVNLRNVHIEDPTDSCIKLETTRLLEEWYFDNVSLYGGQYGVWATVGRWDKSRFTSVETKNNSKNGWYLNLTGPDAGYNGISRTITWINPILHTAGEHAFVAQSSSNQIRNWVFINPYAEGTGTTGKSTRTTGSITSGTPTLTVASATGLTDGDPIVVAGAGTNGVDLFTTISSGGGTTTLTLADTAASTVTPAAITNASYDDFNFELGTGAADIDFLGGYLGDEGTGGHCRYAINAKSVSGTLVLIDVAASGNRPIYDPGRASHIFGRSVVRQPNNFTNHNMTNASFAGVGETVRTLLPSPPGRDLVLALRDSNDNTTGTFGKLEVRVNSAGKTVITEIDGTLFSLRTRGRIVPNGTVGPLSFTASDATPSVQLGNTFQTANGSPTTITNFTNGANAQTIRIRAADANTTVANNATIKTNTGANKLLTQDRVYNFTLYGTVWCEDA